VARGREAQAQLAKLLDDLVSGLVDEAISTSTAAHDAGRHQRWRQGVDRTGGGARRELQPHREGDRLPRLQDAAGLLGSLGKSSFGRPRYAVSRHRHEATVGASITIRGRAHIDVNETLKNSMMRTADITVPMDLEYSDLMVARRVPVELRDGADARLFRIR